MNRHFLLDVCLEGIVNFFTMILAVDAHFFGKLVESFEAIFRPSTWQKIDSAGTANQLVWLAVQALQIFCHVDGLKKTSKLSTNLPW